MANNNQRQITNYMPRTFKETWYSGMIVILLLFVGVTVYNDNFADNNSEETQQMTIMSSLSVNISTEIQLNLTIKESHSFRYLIINTPEIGRDGEADEPYAKEA